MSINLVDAAEQALARAAALGLDQAEVSLHQGTGVSVNARNGELETVEKHNDAQLVISVYQGHKTGAASSADLSTAGIHASVEAAASIASYTGADDCLGLADKERIASHEIELDLWHPWSDDVAELAEVARRCEQAALEADPRISNSEGAAVNSYTGRAVYANSYGFLSQRRASQHSMSCSVIGGQGDSMQRDYWYDSNRNAALMASAEDIGRTAAERTVARLDSRKIASTRAAVLFEPAVAKSLFSHLVGALKGGAIYKKASFLIDSMGEAVLPSFVDVVEFPHLKGGASSAWHDTEGVATMAERALVSEGILQSWVLGSYTARKLGLASTANAGGVRNLRVSNSGQSQADLLRDMGQGLLVTELIGSGINMVTGDYSRGAAGFWVEGGEIQYPVEEITIAGNLKDIYLNIAAIGNDVDSRGNINCGSVLVQDMTIAGS